MGNKEEGRSGTVRQSEARHGVIRRRQTGWEPCDVRAAVCCFVGEADGTETGEAGWSQMRIAVGWVSVAATQVGRQEGVRSTCWSVLQFERRWMPQGHSAALMMPHQRWIETKVRWTQ